MGNPYLNSGESIILTTDRVLVDDIGYDVILTSQRIALVDNLHTDRQPLVIPFASILSVKGQKTPANEPVISITVVDPLGIEDSQTLSLIFSQEPYEDRSPECDMWVKKLIEYVVSARQEPVASTKSEGAQKPAGLQPAVRRWVAPDRPDPHIVSGPHTVNREGHKLLDALQENAPAAPTIPVLRPDPGQDDEYITGPEPEPELVPVPDPQPKEQAQPQVSEKNSIVREISPDGEAPTIKKPASKPGIRKVSQLPEIPVAETKTETEKEKAGVSPRKKPVKNEKAPARKKDPKTREPPQKSQKSTPAVSKTSPAITELPESPVVRTTFAEAAPAHPAEQAREKPAVQSRSTENTGSEEKNGDNPDRENEIVGDSREKREEFWEKAATETFPEPRAPESEPEPVGIEMPDNEPAPAQLQVQTGLPDTVVFPVIRPASEETEKIPGSPEEDDKIPNGDDRGSSGAKKPGRNTIAIAVVTAVIIIALAACIILIIGIAPDGNTTPGEKPTNVTIPIVMATITPNEPAPAKGVWIQVLYNGTFIGTYGNPGPTKQREVRGTGDTIYTITNPDELVQATFKKLDYSGECLTVEVYNNTTRMTRVSKCTPGGSVSILVDPKTGEVPFVPVTTPVP